MVIEWFMKLTGGGFYGKVRKNAERAIAYAIFCEIRSNRCKKRTKDMG